MGLRKDPMYANGLALVANAGLSSVLGFLFWMVAARRFNADALGIGAAVVSAATLAALVGKAGFDAAIVRYAPSSQHPELRRLLWRAASATLALTGVVALGVLAVAWLGMPALAPLLAPPFAIGFVVLSIATAAGWVLDAWFIAEQRAGLVLARNAIFNGVKLIVPIALAASWGGRAVPLAWGIGLAASVAMALACLPWTLARHVPHGDAPTAHPFGYAMRNYALNLSEFLPGLVMPVLVLHALGAEANARFYLAWTLATTGFLASKAIAQSTFAQLVRDPEPRAALLRSLALSGALLLPPAVVLYVAAPQLLSLFGPGYASAAGLLRVLALSIPFIIASNTYLAYLKARDAGFELTALPLASLVALLAAMPLALTLIGIEGAGLAWLAVQAALGTYAGARLAIKILRRNTHVQGRTGLPRHPHQG